MRNRPKSKKPEGQATPAAIALRLVARRDYTRRELATKLAPHVQDAAELEALLDDLATRGWLSEPRVVEQLVHAKQGRLGGARIRHALLKRGVGEELVAAAVAQLRDSELDRARAVCARKFPVPPADATERARRIRFLQGRGFSAEVAMRVVTRLE